MLISVCIPCYRSEKTLPAVVEGIVREFALHPAYEYELILVNDGSPDDTFRVIRALCAQNAHIKGVDLSRNYGQNLALCAAYAQIQGDMAVFMDDDGQHPAAGIFMLLDKLQEGYDVAIAKFPHKKHSLFKRVTSWGHRTLAEWTGTCPKGISYSSFTAWSKVAIEAAKDYRSPFASIGAYLMHVTTRFVNVEMPHNDRLEGESGYTFKKLIALWLTSFTSFSIVPLRAASVMGAICAGIGFIWGFILVIRKLIHPEVAAGYTSMMTLLLLIGGIIMLILGLIGEYIGRIYMTISDMPQYTVREIVGGEKTTA
ncbi:MAG: glycosyltransferase [Clostridia bacterium]|nr:glycosyltransferase [Clostridia bacterium]